MGIARCFVKNRLQWRITLINIHPEFIYSLAAVNLFIETNVFLLGLSTTDEFLTNA